MVTLSYTLDMYPRAVPVVVHLNQYDSDFELVFTLMTSCGTFNIQPGTTAEIRGTKSDGNGYSANCTIDIANSKVTVAGHNQMTAASGKNTYELVLKKNDKVLSTANFILWVEPAAMDAGTITSDTVLKELNAIIESASIATEAAEDASDAADRAEAAAETLEIDATLTHAGQAADAKKTGDEISDLKSAISEIEPGLSDEAKTALLNCFAHVAWIDEHGQDYCDALESALYPNEYPKITAIFNPGNYVVYTGDTLDSLKTYLTVTYYETSESQGTVVASSNYTLSGSLAAGENTIIVSYQSLSSRFVVNAIDYHTVKKWTPSDRLVTIKSTPPGYYNNNGTYTAGVGDGSANTRRTCALTRGEKPFYIAEGSGAGTFADYYPIPVPPDTSTVTVSAGSTSYYVAVLVFRLDKTTGIYSRVQNNTWSQTSQTITYSDADAGDLYITINTKNGSGGTATFSSNPAYSITFS